MTIVNTVDKRNTEWRDNNIGSKLLGKMGWKEGSGIGLRNKNVTALRAVKRQVGLGIGAKRQSEAGPSESTGTFAAVLANLKSHHGGNSDEDEDDEKKKKKKKSKKDKKKKKKNQSKKGGLMLPQNKVLAGHSRKMREAKFGTKSQHDLACIFGNTDVVATAVGSFTPIAAPIQATTKVLPSVAAVSSKKRSRDNDDEDDEDDEDDDDDDDSPSSSSSDADDADDNEELLVTKKEEKEQKRAAKKQRKEEKKKQKKSSTLDDKKKKSKKSSKKI